MDRRMLDEQLWEMRVPMMRLAWSILRHAQNAEDAVSGAMVRAYQKIDTLQDEKALRNWLMRITANACYDPLRKQKREKLWTQQQDASLLFASPQENMLLEMIGLLPGATAEVITLYYYENFSTAEIAQVLGISGATVRMRLSRGRKQLARMMQEGEIGIE